MMLIQRGIHVVVILEFSFLLYFSLVGRIVEVVVGRL
jgi:hypothetical protein